MRWPSRSAPPGKGGMAAFLRRLPSVNPSEKVQILQPNHSLPVVARDVTFLLPHVAIKDDLHHNQATAFDLVWISPDVTQNLLLSSDRWGRGRSLAASRPSASTEHQRGTCHMPMSRSPWRIAALMGGRCRDAGAVHSDEEESPVSFPFRPDHENATLRDDIFTPRNSCLR
jgi:hypothetical protein